MKKLLTMIILGVAVILCAGIVVLIALKDKPQELTNTKTTDASEITLSLQTNSKIDLVFKTTTPLYYYTNYNDSILTYSLSNNNVVYIDDELVIHTLSVGSVVCKVTLTYQNNVKTADTTINVIERSLTFTELNGSDFKSYKSGKNANGKYDTYSLCVDANYDLDLSEKSVSDNVQILSATLINDNMSALVTFNILDAGEVRFDFDEFTYNSSAINYISKLNLEFENDIQITNDTLTLYALSENKDNAYLNGIFDYAKISNLENFDIVIEDENIVSFQSLRFSALSVGETKATFSATDGSLFSKVITVKVENVYATTCDILICDNIEIIEGESFEIGISNFMPNYSVIREISVVTSSNLSYENGTVKSLSTGSGTATVYLNGNLMKTISVTVSEKPDENQGGEPNQNSSEIILTSSSSGVTIDLVNKTITMTAGYKQIRVELTDSHSFIAQIISGSSTVFKDGKILGITAADHSVLRITDTVTSDYFDFQIIVS